MAEIFFPPVKGSAEVHKIPEPFGKNLGGSFVQRLPF